MSYEHTCSIGIGGDTGCAACAKEQDEREKDKERLYQQHRRAAQFWSQIVDLVLAEDKARRGPGPAMADEDIFDIVCKVLLRTAKDSENTRLGARLRRLPVGQGIVRHKRGFRIVTDQDGWSDENETPEAAFAQWESWMRGEHRPEEKSKAEKSLSYILAELRHLYKILSDSKAIRPTDESLVLKIGYLIQEGERGCSHAG